jgi:predicted RNA-binding protein with EMAP domain
VMKVASVRAHPDDDGLRCYQVAANGGIRTQVVGGAGLSEGDAVVVALSGCRLLDGSIVVHSFVGRAFSAGRVVQESDLLPDSGVTSAHRVKRGNESQIESRWGHRRRTAAQQRVATDKVRKEWPLRLPRVGPVVEGGPCG